VNPALSRQLKEPLYCLGLAKGWVSRSLEVVIPSVLIDKLLYLNKMARHKRSHAISETIAER